MRRQTKSDLPKPSKSLTNVDVGIKETRGKEAFFINKEQGKENIQAFLSLQYITYQEYCNLIRNIFTVSPGGDGRLKEIVTQNRKQLPLDQTPFTETTDIMIEVSLQAAVLCPIVGWE